MVKNKNELSKPVIEIKEMHKWFGNFHVLKNISLGVNQGDRIVICGPSGSGKSTLSANLSVLWSNSGYKVAVIDADAQKSLSYWLEARKSYYGEDDIGTYFIISYNY